MLAFRNLRIGTKLTWLVIMSSVGFAVFAAFALYTLGVVRVNGPIYQSLAQNQELVADVLPPPSYIIESYLTTIRILDAAEHNDTETIGALLEKAAALQAEYELRHEYWVNALASSESTAINNALLLDSYQPAQTYFQIFNDQFVPAVQAGDVDQLESILHEQLAPAYEQHRAAIDEVVTLQNAAIRENESGAQVLVDRSIFLLVLLAFLTVVLVVGFSVFISRSITRPVSQLTQVANQISSGELEAQASTDTTDEVGVLAGAFNSMTARLRDTLGSLEQRVVARTRNLQLAAEVGRSVSQVRALDVMLKDACELILKEFNLYYVQVYLTDPSRTTLTLEAGTGDVGAQLLERGHSLPLNVNSINGRAAVEKHSVVIANTSQSATFRQNPLLPDTRGEAAVPLLVGDHAVGVLDMQSREAGVLTEEILPAFEALAGQLAVAIQNANLLAEAESARAQVEAQARRLVRQGWDEHLDAIHMPEQLGFVFKHNNITRLAPVDEGQLPAAGDSVSAPIAVAGEAVGSLAVEINDDSQREQTMELVSVVARQVAQQIENLRILNSAERYRLEAEEASRRLTREGWKSYTERTNEGIGYVYDLNEVRPYRQDEVEQVEEPALSLPLKVRDEAIGKLVVKDINDKDDDSVGLVSVVAERLSQHIEGLRLSLQTEQALASTRKQAQREQALRQITNAVRSSTDPATILRAAARELGSLLGRQTIVHMTTAVEAKTGQSAHSVGTAGEAVANDGNESAAYTDQS